MQCCRAIKTKLIGVAVIAYQCPLSTQGVNFIQKVLNILYL